MKTWQIKDMKKGCGNTNVTRRNEVKSIKELTSGKEKQKEKDWKLATWNVRGLNGKEMELEMEFEKYDIDILAVTETKKKGEGQQVTKNGHLLVYKGVEQGKHGAAGVACLINNKLGKNIDTWEAITERILTLNIKT